ncbi:MAG: roadblock/LC7 domain-containing protein [candidate division Zixibacteria bacterium]
MIDRSNIDERIAKCTKILDENPGSQIFAALAEAHRKKGDLDKAFRICQNGLKIHPDYGSAHLVMAKINMDKGMYDWAETEAVRAVELDGETRTTELLLSEIFIYKNEFNKACRLLEKLHEGDPENVHIKKLLEIARKIPLEQPNQPDANHVAPAPQAPTVRISPTPQERDHPAPVQTITQEAPPVQADMNYKQMLRALVETPGIEGVLIINSDGLVIESIWNVSGDTDLVGALAVETARFTTIQIREGGFGQLQSMMIETPKSLYYMAGIKGKLLAIVCTESINLGSLKMKLTNLLPRLTQ